MWRALSTAAPDLRLSTVARAVYECVLYADLFDCAITVAEICRRAAVPLLDQTAVTRILRDETLAERLSWQGDLAVSAAARSFFRFGSGAWTALAGCGTKPAAGLDSSPPPPSCA